MRYTLARRLRGWGEQYEVKDDRDKPLFHIKARFFTLSRRMDLVDLQGTPILALSRADLYGRVHYFHRDVRRVGEMVRDGDWKPRFSLRFDGMDDLEIRGNFWQSRFDVLRDGGPVARITKRWGWCARYEIDIAEGSDELPVFLIAMVLYDVYEANPG